MILRVGMHVKPTIPGAVIRFPSDPRRRVPDEGCEMPVSGMDAEHFQRLLLTKELSMVAPAVRVAPVLAAEAAEVEPSTEPDAPTGREPVTPLTTR